MIGNKLRKQFQMPYNEIVEHGTLKIKIKVIY